MSSDVAPVPDLTVRGEPIERAYGNYAEKRYLVNRRYQRKLIWTIDEKTSFIDSILRGYPVPLILLVENRLDGRNVFEILDGLQRLNAVMSFIENDYSVEGVYFDLNTIAVTKSFLDGGTLTQRTPVMSRDKCVRIASYTLPLSIYESPHSKSTDTVFRRINSGGRKLSRQELRAAGATGHFASVVRKIAAKVRGDDSAFDTIRLNDMKKISITNRELAYGVDVDQIFWVAEGILTKEQVRASKDEELISDLVAYTVSEDPVSSRSEFIDDYFGMKDDDNSRARYNQFERYVQRRSPELVISDFQRSLDEVRATLTLSGSTFGNLLFGNQPPRAPRYFQAVFLAFFELIVRDNKEVKDRQGLVKQMRNNGSQIHIPEGGRWGGEHRKTTAQAVVGMYQNCFSPSDAYDPAKVHWITQLENILSQSYTEQSAYDFKQGFTRLDDTGNFDDDNFAKIMQTCVGIANIGRGVRGYVLVGIADTAATAQRVEYMCDVKPRPFQSFFITGIDHEVAKLKKDHDGLFNFVVERVRSSLVSDPLRGFIASNLKAVKYYDRTIYVFEARGQDDPSQYSGHYYQRAGSQLHKVKSEDLTAFIKRYILA